MTSQKFDPFPFSYGKSVTYMSPPCQFYNTSFTYFNLNYIITMLKSFNIKKYSLFKAITPDLHQDLSVTYIDGSSSVNRINQGWPNHCPGAKICPARLFHVPFELFENCVYEAVFSNLQHLT